ncbi:MAG: ferritin family protein [Spirochaetota bacterium]
MTLDDYKKIISNAILNEIEAYTFYNAVANKVKDIKLKEMFTSLAGEEQKHKLTLEGFLKKAPEKIHFSASKDYKVADTLPTPPLTIDLKPLDALIIAIKKELEAMQMYTQLANASADEGQKKIFAELVSMERGHKSKLEDIYTDMAFPEVW